VWDEFIVVWCFEDDSPDVVATSPVKTWPHKPCLVLIRPLHVSDTRPGFFPLLNGLTETSSSLFHGFNPINRIVPHFIFVFVSLFHE